MLEQELTKRGAIEHLEELLLQQARWRRGVAERYPDDRRNLNSASAQERMAALLKELPDDAPELAPLDEVVELCNRHGHADHFEVWLSLGGEDDPQADRIGFRNEPTPDEDLPALVQLACEKVLGSYQLQLAREQVGADNGAAKTPAHGSRGLGKSWLPTSSEASEDDRLQRYMIAAELELDAADVHWRSGFTEEEIEARLVRDAEQYMEDVDEGHRDAVTETLEELEERRG